MSKMPEMPKMPKVTIVRRVGILGHLRPGLAILERRARPTYDPGARCQGARATGRSANSVGWSLANSPCGTFR